MISIDPNSLLVRQPDLVAAEMDGDLVMMSIERGEYFGLEGIGPHVWALLEQPLTVEQITAKLCEEFEVEDAVCRQDVLAFTSELLNLGLIRFV